MGKSLRYYSDGDKYDNPNLNKCPDCECLYEGEFCPICGKACPEEMRAGNRKVVKRKKHTSNSNNRVMFISWYHTWWFIGLMLLFMPIVGIILLITSPYKKKTKIILIAIFVVYTLLFSYGIGDQIINSIKDKTLVNTMISESEYKERCVEKDPVEYYRVAKDKNEYVKMSVHISSRDIDVSDYSSSNTIYYLVYSDNQVIFMLRDCLVNDMRLLPGDDVTIYGQFAGEKIIYIGNEYNEVSAVCINIAYADIKK